MSHIVQELRFLMFPGVYTQQPLSCSVVLRVRTLCMLLDADKNGMIDLDEFVSGCMQLHGPAKSLQLAKMSFENKYPSCTTVFVL